MWTATIERDPRYRGAAEGLAAEGYSITITPGTIVLTRDDGREVHRLHARKDFLAFAAAVVAGAPPPKPKGRAVPSGGEDEGEAPPRKARRPRTVSDTDEMARLEAALTAMTLERDAWRLKAGGGPDGAPSDAAGRYRRLKTFLARAFHPDQAGPADERLSRAEVFRIVWAEIEAIERAGEGRRRG